MGKKPAKRKAHPLRPNRPSVSVKRSSKPVTEKQLSRIDELVRKIGEMDTGAPLLELCPRCGSGDIHARRIDIPGFAPEVQVCGKCGYRSESAVQVDPIDYVEEVEEELAGEEKIEEIQRRLQKSLEEHALKPSRAKRPRVKKRTKKRR